MARIECRNAEQKMADLRGVCKSYADPNKNPYTTEKLNDDQYNFISGMNYVLSLITDEFMENLDDYISDEDSKMLDAIKKDIAAKTIEYFAEFGYYDVAEQITNFIEMDDSEWEKVK